MYKLVLVGTDGSETASRAVESAARLAHVHQARLTIAYAFSGKGHAGSSSEDLPGEMSWLATPGGAADALVRSAVDLAQATACGALEVEGRAKLGSPRAVLRSLIDELAPDAVVVGNADARRSLLGRGLGSALARQTSTDVIIVDTSSESRARRAPRRAA